MGPQPHRGSSPAGGCTSTASTLAMEAAALWTSPSGQRAPQGSQGPLPLGRVPAAQGCPVSTPPPAQPGKAATRDLRRLPGPTPSQADTSDLPWEPPRPCTPFSVVDPVCTLPAPSTCLQPTSLLTAALTPPPSQVHSTEVTDVNVGTQRPCGAHSASQDPNPEQV